MISLLRQKQLRRRDRGAIAVGFLGDRYELGEIALGFVPSPKRSAACAAL
jgi:hypothetical protein